MVDDILPIGMDEMNRIFEIVDELEISRESIQVDLLPEGDGVIELLESGKIRIVLPEGRDLSAWLPTLEQRLGRLGSQATGAQP